LNDDGGEIERRNPPPDLVEAAGGDAKVADAIALRCIQPQ